MNRNFIDELEERILLADGAMGTMLYAKGVYINTCFDELNLSRPSLVSDIHKEYLQAGAEILETNTFGANRFKLATFGIEDRVKQINEAGADLARSSANKAAFIAGSIGPLGKPLRPLGKISKEDAFAAFKEQAEALAPNVDLFIVETIHSLEEMRIAIEAIKSISSLPIVAQMTFTDEEQTLAGESPEQVARGLESYDVACIGINCSIGPQPMLEIIEKMGAVTDKILSAQPNAGSPRLVENRFIYLTSPEYMAEYAKRFIQTGVSIVGGCCGTTPEHIKAMASAIRALRPVHVHTHKSLEVVAEREVLPETPFEQRSRLAASLGKKFVISVEIDPPRGLDPSRPLEAARLMKKSGVDAINIADGPRASARMSPMALATLMEKEAGIETLLHYCCRDRNLLGMQADLIGAHALGLRNVLIITGDPPKLGDYPSATAVFDVDSIGLVQIVRNLNRGLDLAGNPLGAATSFAIGVGANPGAMDLETEIKRFYEKVESGAEFVLTQPVYEASLLENFINKTRNVEIPILVGILPLSSYKNAEFLHNEVPGMQIPKKIRSRMKRTPSGDAARRLGIKIAQEALQDCMTLQAVKGAYIMPPFGRYESVLRIIEVL
ncbi:MAG: bifunctional homocysteine S-methyltransferase/methylenetetrahydrofolate reductase [Candidatus Latescibacteria bacterium]|nr:bifunctional homocysteine S-methyltransferase/methylenetetrahydrofolate reductase [Candidatus Latescibacterota bacterium]NIM21382.1 bifunctional homocysteine S-methyltransferase/methylenetetrahydrofolate reductase [Candidatus Latescibacterota bacterium]NIM65563.1 bifunctional homocysteine S-methyltransferase/methylenetetrahydrofolate reductase [Candidatus Latescibacterota bacterium]NIO01943.1 bifunctional homocysteine S-methyltransferase/methylenetetrahydrofolate reductase [Candidatus Latesci